MDLNETHKRNDPQILATDIHVHHDIHMGKPDIKKIGIFITGIYQVINVILLLSTTDGNIFFSGTRHHPLRSFLRRL